MSAPRIRRNRLCRNPLIATELGVTYAVTDHNPVNIQMEPTRQTVRIPKERVCIVEPSQCMRGAGRADVVAGGGIALVAHHDQLKAAARHTASTSSFGKASANLLISARRPPCHDLSALARTAAMFCDCSAVTNGASPTVSTTEARSNQTRRDMVFGRV